MAKVMLGLSQPNNLSLGAAVSRYYPAHYTRFNTTSSSNEANNQVTYRTAGTLSGLYIKVIVNSRGASTLTSRINSADGAQSVSIGASTTGEFEDAVNTDSIVVGDEVGCKITTGAGGTALNATIISFIFDATTNTSMRAGTCANATVSNANTTRYIGLSSDSTQGGSSVSRRQFEINSSATWKNLYLIVSANARTSATIFRSDVNGAAGALTLSVGAETTGVFEDTTNTIALVSGDLIQYASVTGVETGVALTMEVLSSELVSTDDSWHMICASINNAVIPFGATNYLEMFGGGQIESATEADYAADIRVGCTVSNFWVDVDVNTVNGTSTITVRQNATDTILSVSVGASTTGAFEDTDSVVYVATDEIAVKTVTGGTSGNLEQAIWGAKAVTTGAEGGTHFLSLLGVGS